MSGIVFKVGENEMERAAGALAADAKLSGLPEATVTPQVDTPVETQNKPPKTMMA